VNERNRGGRRRRSPPNRNHPFFSRSTTDTDPAVEPSVAAAATEIWPPAVSPASASAGGMRQSPIPDPTTATAEAASAPSRPGDSPVPRRRRRSGPAEATSGAQRRIGGGVPRWGGGRKPSWSLACGAARQTVATDAAGASRCMRRIEEAAARVKSRERE
jgi:hypothetical protein